MRVKLTPRLVKTARAADGVDRSLFWDASMEGFGLMITSTGHRSWVVQYRADGISRRYTIDGRLSLASARKKAKAVQGLVAHGRDPVAEERKKKAEATNTLKAIAEEYMRRDGKKLRSIGERRRILKKYIFPKLGSRQIDTIKRSEIVRLLDQIEDDNGPVMADHVLSLLRVVMHWHAKRGDDFCSPIVRGMNRTKVKERARERILTDGELRVVWEAAELFPGPYGHLVKFLLLTAVRLREATKMTRGELSVEGTEWTIPAARHKSKRDFLVPLSKAAQATLAETPVIGGRGLVFTNDGVTSLSGFSKTKLRFDEAVLEELRKVDPKAKPLPRWTNHDLRRTARSLMSRAGVPPRHAEMALGHVIAGVEGTYDRHSYKDEKRAAFEALALQIERILNPRSNVIPMPGADRDLKVGVAAVAGSPRG